MQILVDGSPKWVWKPLDGLGLDAKSIQELENLINLWGNKVQDYKMQILVDGSHKWVWKPLDGLGLDAKSI